MSDSFSVVSSESWLSRIGSSIKGVLVGLLLFIVSFPLLFWNEGRAVTTARSLEEGAGAVISVPADRVDPSHEGKLVHVAGDATTSEVLTDSDFGVSVSAIRLDRTVEMYQWDEDKRTEKRKKLGGGSETVTTYNYEKRWASRLIDSRDFKRPEGHENPSRMPFEGQTLYAKQVKLGAFTLSREQLQKLGGEEALKVDGAAAPRTAGGLPVSVDQGVLYLGEGAGSPKVGSVRVSFNVIRPGPVSVVAQQAGSSFASYQTKAGDSLLLVDEGTRSAAEMFKSAETANTALTWVLRVVGFFLMFAGLAMVFKPISVVADVVPFIGSALGVGLGVFSFLIAAPLSLVTIAVAWFFYRPLLGIVLLVLAGAGIFGLVSLSKKRKAARAA